MELDTNRIFPQGWDEERVRKVLAHYENQSEDEAVAEDEAAYHAEGQNRHDRPHRVCSGHS
jgi:hypothetical protein